MKRIIQFIQFLCTDIQSRRFSVLVFGLFIFVNSGAQAPKLFVNTSLDTVQLFASNTNQLYVFSKNPSCTGCKVEFSNFFRKHKRFEISGVLWPPCQVMLNMKEIEMEWKSIVSNDIRVYFSIESMDGTTLFDELNLRETPGLLIWNADQKRFIVLQGIDLFDGVTLMPGLKKRLSKILRS